MRGALNIKNLTNKALVVEIEEMIQAMRMKESTDDQKPENPVIITEVVLVKEEKGTLQTGIQTTGAEIEMTLNVYQWHRVRLQEHLISVQVLQI